METTQRSMRADAIRNRVKILDAARTELATHGTEAGMDQIAAAAGVAVGTLYRHFPTKTDLVNAVLAEYTEQITAEAETALLRAQKDASPLAALVTFLREVIRISAINEAAKTAAPALGASTDLDATRAATAMTQLINLGITAGQVRADLTIADIYTMISSAPLNESNPVRERWMDLFLPCLTVEAATIQIPSTTTVGPSPH